MARTSQMAHRPSQEPRRVRSPARDRTPRVAGCPDLNHRPIYSQPTRGHCSVVRGVGGTCVGLRACMCSVDHCRQADANSQCAEVHLGLDIFRCLWKARQEHRGALRTGDPWIERAPGLVAHRSDRESSQAQPRSANVCIPYLRGGYGVHGCAVSSSTMSGGEDDGSRR